jgi:hypothetical protein
MSGLHGSLKSCSSCAVQTAIPNDKHHGCVLLGICDWRIERRYECKVRRQACLVRASKRSVDAVFPANLGELLAAPRAMLGLSQIDLAAALDVTVNLVSLGNRTRLANG